MGFDGRKSLYDADFYAWTQRQAAALRGLSPAQIGNAVDLVHVAEEIEDLGKREVREVESLLMRLFEHLLKLAYLPNADTRNHWLHEIGGFQGLAALSYKPSMAQAIDLQRVWKLGRREALRFLHDAGVKAEPPETCPFPLDGLIADEFDPLELLRSLAAR